MQCNSKCETHTYIVWSPASANPFQVIFENEELAIALALNIQYTH